MSADITSSKRIAKNTVYLYLRMILVMAVGLYTSRAILQILGALDYGIYNVVGGVVTMASFINAAMSVASSRQLTYEIGKGNTLRLNKTFAAALNLHLLIALFTLVLAETVGLWFFYEKLVIPPDRMQAAFWVYQFSVLSMMVSFTQVPYNASLIAHENMSVFAYIGLYDAISKLAVVYMLYLSPIDKLIFYALLLFLSSMFVQLLLRWYTQRHYNECHFCWLKEPEFYKPLISYSGWNLVGGFSYIIQNQGISILLNLFFGPLVNTARAITNQVQSALLQFITNFLTAVRPQVIKSYAQSDYDKMYGLTFQAGKFSIYLMLALLIPLCFELDFILSLWLGDNVPEYTYIFTLIVLVTNLIDLYCQIVNMPFAAIGEMKYGNLGGGILQILALPLGYVFLKLGLSPYWVFIAIMITIVLKTIFMWYITRHYVWFSLRDVFEQLFKPTMIVIFSSLLVPTIICQYMDDGWMRFFVLSVSSEICLAVIIYMRGMTASEKQTLYRYLLKIRR